MSTHEIIAEGFKAIKEEIKERDLHFADPLTPKEIQTKLNGILKEIKEDTGMNFDLPTITMMFETYQGGHI